jgi:hypothetical protein
MHLISRDFGVGQVLIRLQRPIKVDAKRIEREEGRDARSQGGIYVGGIRPWLISTF